MDKIKLKVGDVFTHTRQSPLHYRVLEIDRATNYIKVELISPYDVVGYNENWSLDSTEAGFEVGDYKLIK